MFENKDAKNKIARRAAKEVRDGQIINLGIGIPTLIPRYFPKDRSVLIQSENGIVGMGDRADRTTADRNLIDAGGNYIHTVAGAAFCDSVLSFAVIRGGRLDIAFLGALEVSETGDLANWIIPGKFAPGIGGGMELAQKARRVVVVTTHMDRKGRPKIRHRCKLPLTAKKRVSKIISELAVIDVTDQGLALREISSETTIDEVSAKTDATLRLPAGEMETF